MIIPTLRIGGTAFERGRKHGSMAVNRVRRSIENYKHLFSWTGLKWEEAKEHALAFRDVIGNLDNALIEEIEGIAAGADVPMSEVLALNTRTELIGSAIPAYHPLNIKNECTALAVSCVATSHGSTLLAQNWDWLRCQRDALLLLEIEEQELGTTTAMLTEAGIIGKMGCNSAHFGVTLNILHAKDDGKNLGVPVHILLRHLLRRCGTVDSAKELLKTLTFSASSNVLCADYFGGILSAEVSPQGLGLIDWWKKVGVHTNHFMTTPDVGELMEWQEGLENSYAREARCLSLLEARTSRGISFNDVRQVLGDQDEMCPLHFLAGRHAPSLSVETVATVIMELSLSKIHAWRDHPSSDDVSYARASNV